LKSQSQRHSHRFRIASRPIPRTGTSGTTRSNLILQKNLLSLVSGTPNVRTNLRKWLS
jgi:hypothetical protein